MFQLKSPTHILHLFQQLLLPSCSRSLQAYQPESVCYTKSNETKQNLKTESGLFPMAEPQKEEEAQHSTLNVTQRYLHEEAEQQRMKEGSDVVGAAVRTTTDCK